MLGEYLGFKDGEAVINNEPYLIPLLSFYSDDVMNYTIGNPDYIYPNKYITEISDEAFEVWIKGSNHMSYTDLPLFSPLLSNMLGG